MICRFSHVCGPHRRTTETGDIALTQCIVAVLVGADVVVVALLDNGSTLAAGFQALATLAKGPIYVAAGTVLVAFPLLRTPGARIGEILTAALRSFGQLALLASAVIATVPVGLAILVLPERYVDALGMMPWLAAAGLGFATLTVLATVLLALRAYRRCQLGLLLACVLVTAGLLLGWEIAGVTGLAAGSAIGSLLAAGALALIAFPLLPTGTVRMTLRGLALTAVLLVVLGLARPQPILWLVVVVITGVALLLSMRDGRLARHGIDRSAGRRVPEEQRLRVLYLDWPEAEESPSRTHQVHRRLASRHSITVLSKRYPGSSDFTSDGVRYVHLGLGNRMPGLGRISYLLALPFAIARYAPDLVVTGDRLPRFLNDPRWTGRPTVSTSNDPREAMPTAEQRRTDPLWGRKEHDWALVAEKHHSMYIAAVAQTSSERFNTRTGA
jgi:hypothetical protein